MASVRYTNIAGGVEVLKAETLKQAKRLYAYAVRVATAPVLIELLHDGEVIKSYQVAK